MRGESHLVPNLHLVRPAPIVPNLSLGPDSDKPIPTRVEVPHHGHDRAKSRTAAWPSFGKTCWILYLSNMRALQIMPYLSSKKDKSVLANKSKSDADPAMGLMRLGDLPAGRTLPFDPDFALARDRGVQDGLVIDQDLRVRVAELGRQDKDQALL